MKYTKSFIVASPAAESEFNISLISAELNLNRSMSSSSESGAEATEQACRTLKSFMLLRPIAALRAKPMLPSMSSCVYRSAKSLRLLSLAADFAAAHTRLLRYMGLPSSLNAASRSISMSDSTPYWRHRSVIMDEDRSSSSPASSIASTEPNTLPASTRFEEAAATKEKSHDERDEMSSAATAAPLPEGPWYSARSMSSRIMYTGIPE